MRHRFDATRVLKDAGLVAASGGATVGGSARILDMGQARFSAFAVVDVTAIETATGDEKYTILVQGSDTANFSGNVVNLAMAQFGHISTFLGGANVQPGTGRYEIAVWNEVNGTVYRYVRIYVAVAGTIATGINFSAFLAADEIY